MYTTKVVRLSSTVVLELGYYNGILYRIVRYNTAGRRM